MARLYIKLILSPWEIWFDNLTHNMRINGNKESQKHSLWL